MRFLLLAVLVAISYAQTECKNFGRRVDGVCECTPNYTGETCETRRTFEGWQWFVMWTEGETCADRGYFPIRNDVECYIASRELYNWDITKMAMTKFDEDGFPGCWTAPGVGSINHQTELVDLVGWDLAKKLVCKHLKDEVAPPQVKSRLVDGTTGQPSEDNKGLLQVWDFDWNYWCDSGKTSEQDLDAVANLACLEMGYSGVASIQGNQGLAGLPKWWEVLVNEMFIGHFDCLGSETSLFHCDYSLGVADSDCDLSSAIEVTCTSEAAVPNTADPTADLEPYGECSEEVITTFFDFVRSTNTDECNTAMKGEDGSLPTICACLSSADFTQFSNEECKIDKEDEFTLARYIDICASENTTADPTSQPTSIPTLSPTFNPTAAPTINPTLSPTSAPTINPTLNPTEAPTIYPTLNPTAAPTINPTLKPTAKPTIPTGYEHINKGCVHGSNIVLYRQKSVSECAALCDQNDDCFAFEYGVNHGGAHTGYSSRDCQLQSSADYKGCAGKYYNLDLYIKATPPKPIVDTGNCAWEGNWFFRISPGYCSCPGGFVKIGRWGYWSEWQKVEGAGVTCESEQDVWPLWGVTKECRCGQRGGKVGNNRRSLKIHPLA